MEFFYKIAGLTVSIESFGRTVRQAEPYKVEPGNPVDIRVESFWEERKHERPFLSDDDGEYLATGSDFYKKLLKFNGLMLHASAVVVDGRAYLFSADPGTGKSTHAKLWLDMFGNRAFILNDDKPAIRLIDNQWFAYGTPWSGKNDISVNTSAPIAGIAMLQRGSENKIELWNDENVILALMKQVNRPREMQCRIKLMELLDQLITKVPIWKLKCTIESDAAKISYEAMSRK